MNQSDERKAGLDDLTVVPWQPRTTAAWLRWWRDQNRLQIQGWWWWYGVMLGSVFPPVTEIYVEAKQIIPCSARVAYSSKGMLDSNCVNGTLEGLMTVTALSGLYRLLMSSEKRKEVLAKTPAQPSPGSGLSDLPSVWERIQSTKSCSSSGSCFWPFLLWSSRARERARAWFSCWSWWGRKKDQDRHTANAFRSSMLRPSQSDFSNFNLLIPGRYPGISLMVIW